MGRIQVRRGYEHTTSFVHPSFLLLLAHSICIQSGLTLERKPRSLHCHSKERKKDRQTESKKLSFSIRIPCMYVCVHMTSKPEEARHMASVINCNPSDWVVAQWEKEKRKGERSKQRTGRERSRNGKLLIKWQVLYPQKDNKLAGVDDGSKSIQTLLLSFHIFYSFTAIYDPKGHKSLVRDSVPILTFESRKKLTILLLLKGPHKHYQRLKLLKKKWISKASNLITNFYSDPE